MSITLDSTHNQLCSVIHKYVTDHLEDLDITINGLRTELVDKVSSHYENKIISFKADDLFSVYIGGTIGTPKYGSVYKYTFTLEGVTYEESCWSDISPEAYEDGWGDIDE